MATSEFKNWRYYSFEIRHKEKKRIVEVFTPAPVSAAIFATGKCDDEEIITKHIDHFDEKFRALTTSKRPKGAELASFYRGMARALAANADLKLAFGLVAPKAKTPIMRGIIAAMYHERQQVQDPSLLFAKYPMAFNRIAQTVIAQGFNLGNQARAFQQLADEAEDNQDLLSEVYAAAWYPGLLFGCTMLALLFLNLVVFPKMGAVWGSLNFQLPLVTRILMFFIQHILTNPCLSLLMPAIVVYAWIRREKILAKYWVQRRMVRLPVLGGFYRRLVLQRSLHSLSLFYSNSVPQKQSYGIVAEVSHNIVFSEYFLAIRSHLSKGVSLYSAFHLERDRIGEEGLDVANEMKLAGAAAEEGAVLASIANLYKKEIGRLAKNFPKLVEPVLIAGIGSIIGTTLLGLYLPNLEFALASLKDANRFSKVQATAPVKPGGK